MSVDPDEIEAKYYYADSLQYSSMDNEFKQTKLVRVNNISVTMTQNYKGTGRTLVTIKCTQPELSDSTPTTSYNESQKSLRMKSGFIVKMPAVYPNSEMNAWGTDTMNYVSSYVEGARSGNNNDADSSVIPADMKDAMSGLPAAGWEDGEKDFFYAKAPAKFLNVTSSDAGFHKDVKASEDLDYSVLTEEKTKAVYNYRLRYQTDTGDEAKNLIIFDTLEDDFDIYENGAKTGTHTHWQGTFESVDVSHAESLGCKPVVYYSTEVLSPEKNNGDADLSDSSKWSVLDDSVDKSSIKTIAFDLRHKEDGSDFILGSGQAVHVYIYMKAPDNVTPATQDDPVVYAYNDSVVQTQIRNSGSSSWGSVDIKSSNYTRVSLTDPYGDLKITKKVNGYGNTTLEKNHEFTFVISKLEDDGENVDTDFSGDYKCGNDYVSFSNGIARITLKHGQSKTIEDLPAGMKYKVEEELDETADAGFELVSKSGDSGVVDSVNIPHAQFTNRVAKYGNLIVTKNVAGLPDNPDDDNSEQAASRAKEFDFKVSILKDDGTVDTDFTGKYGGMDFKNGVAEFSLSHGKSVTGSNLPAGRKYKVEESDYTLDGYVTSQDNGNGEIKANTIVRDTVTNTFNGFGTLVVRKTVNGYGADKTKEFDFRVTLNPKYTGTFGDLEFNNGVADFKLSNGQQKTIRNLPLGTKYIVQESNPGEYSVVPSGGKTTGTISKKNTTYRANYTNTLNKYGNLKVIKKTAGAIEDADKDKSYHFKIYILDDNGETDTTFNGTYGDMEFVSGLAEIDIKSGESKEARLLPKGTKYRVEENDYRAEGFTTSYVSSQTDEEDSDDEEPEDVPSSSGSITVNKTEDVTATNTYNGKGNLSITKILEGVMADPEKEFEFEVTLKGFPVNKIFEVTVERDEKEQDNETLEFTYDEESKESKAVINLKSGETKTITGLPANANAEGDPSITYSVSEKDYSDDGYETEYLTKNILEGTIKKGETAKIEVQNINPDTPTPEKKIISDGKEADEHTLKMRDETFTYVVRALIPRNAKKARLSDTLKDELEFADPANAAVSIKDAEDDFSSLVSVDGKSISVNLNEDIIRKYGGRELTLKFDAVITEGADLSKYKVDGVVKIPNVATYKIDNEPELETEPVMVTPPIDIPVSKIWDDEDDITGVRPESITVKLLANEKDTGLKLTLSEDNNWKDVFKDLPQCDEDAVIEYTVEEETVDFYNDPVIEGNQEEGFTITNNLEYLTTEETTGGKTWIDDDDALKIRPESITVNLFADGELIDTVTVTEKDDWNYSFGNLPKYFDGELIEYTVEEEAVDGYKATYEGFNITNECTQTKPLVTLAGTIKKEWNDSNNSNGNRPKSVRVHILDDKLETVESFVLSEENSWTFKTKDLPEFDEDGNRISYYVYEETVKGYTFTDLKSAGKDTAVIVNTENSRIDTGDHAPTSALIALMTICAAGIAAMMFKRRKDN